MDYELADRYALKQALLALHICPNRRCGRAELKPVALAEHVYGCEQCRETWFIEPPAPAQDK